MRWLVAALLLAGPASAWEAGTEGRLCTLDDARPTHDVRLTYDPAGPVYTITVTRRAPWPLGPVFAMQFLPEASNTISTNRHRLSPDGLSLTVTDRGFGNVLDGLQFNSRAFAGVGNIVVELDLEGAAAAVAAFRACTAAPSV